MSFRTPQAVLAFLALQLRDRCRAADAAFVSWRFSGELADAQQQPDDLETDAPRVVLQSGPGQFAITDSLHPCFRYDGELTAFIQPAGAQMRPETFMHRLAQVEALFRSLLAEYSAQPLVDPTDDVAGCFLVSSYAETSSAEASELYFLLKIPFTLILQF